VVVEQSHLQEPAGRHATKTHGEQWQSQPRTLCSHHTHEPSVSAIAGEEGGGRMY
jgi:hypothetical protein